MKHLLNRLELVEQISIYQALSEFLNHCPAIETQIIKLLGISDENLKNLIHWRSSNWLYNSCIKYFGLKKILEFSRKLVNANTYLIQEANKYGYFELVSMWNIECKCGFWEDMTGDSNRAKAQSFDFIGFKESNENIFLYKCPDCNYIVEKHNEDFYYSVIQIEKEKPKKYAKKCSICGKVFNKGYVDGNDYLCQQCIFERYTLTEWERKQETFPNFSYYTEWEYEGDYLYYGDGSLVY